MLKFHLVPCRFCKQSVKRSYSLKVARCFDCDMARSRKRANAKTNPNTGDYIDSIKLLDRQEREKLNNRERTFYNLYGKKPTFLELEQFMKHTGGKVSKLA